MFNSEEVAEIGRLTEEARLAGNEASARTLRGILQKVQALVGSAPAGSARLELFEEVLPLAECPPHSAAAAEVRRALERQESIRIRYRANRTGEVTQRRIRPFNIHFYNGQEYVEAFCELRGSDRIFALGNIEEILDPSPDSATGAEPAA